MLVAAGFACANAQFTPNLKTVDAIADNNVEEAQAYADAAAALPGSTAQMQAIAGLNNKEQAALTGNASGCVMDYSTGECMKSSFLQGAFDAAIRPIIQRTLDSTPDPGSFERRTQAPMIWMKFHKAHTPSGTGETFADFAASKSFLQEPTFPGNSASNANAISNIITQATSSPQYQAKTQNSASVIAQAKAEGQRILAKEAKAAERMNSMKSTAFTLVRNQIVKSLHAGGCARDYSAACPLGWSSENGACVPSADYTGPCGTGSAGTSASQKESFAIQCAASWACADGAVSFSVCPAGWTAQGGACTAPTNYSGICSTTTDFSGMSNEQKAKWAAMCGAHW